MDLEKIAYERQEDPTSNRMCGAAALSMVLRSFEIVSTQEDLWPKISTPGATGPTLGRTYLLAAEAIRQGLSALVVQARNPLHMLKRCQEESIPAVINHRANLDSPAGHYSVLLGVKDGYALVHDPLLGHGRCVSMSRLSKNHSSETGTDSWLYHGRLFRKKLGDDFLPLLRRSIVQSPRASPGLSRRSEGRRFESSGSFSRP